MHTLTAERADQKKRKSILNSRENRQRNRRGEDKGKGKGRTKDKHRGKGLSPFDKEATAEVTGAAGLKPEPPSISAFDDLEVELGAFTLKQEEESSRAVQV